MTLDHCEYKRLWVRKLRNYNKTTEKVKSEFSASVERTKLYQQRQHSIRL